MLKAGDLVVAPDGITYRVREDWNYTGAYACIVKVYVTKPEGKQISTFLRDDLRKVEG